jgi:hypothetical protein
LRKEMEEFDTKATNVSVDSVNRSRIHSNTLHRLFNIIYIIRKLAGGRTMVGEPINLPYVRSATERLEGISQNTDRHPLFSPSCSGCHWPVQGQLLLAGPFSFPDYSLLVAVSYWFNPFIPARMSLAETRLYQFDMLAFVYRRMFAFVYQRPAIFFLKMAFYNLKTYPQWKEKI